VGDDGAARAYAAVAGDWSRSEVSARTAGARELKI
jgi:hypothetical protein